MQRLDDDMPISPVRRNEMKIWSELPRSRVREMGADAATSLWLLLWAIIGWQAFSWLAELAGAGRIVRDGGTNLDSAGRQLAGAIEGIPLVGEGAASGVSRAFGDAARPLVQFGTDLERLLIVMAALLTALLVAVALTPWLTRYLPWRIARLRRLRAAHRVLRRAPAGVGKAEIDRFLASRALHRMEYDELLDYSADPLGDWIGGRYDALAQAELASVGLRPNGK